MIVIELTHCPAGAKGGNHVTARREDWGSNATNTNRMLLIVHGITPPPCKRQFF
jgi:hypothetical protein